MNVFGPIVSGWDVEQALEAHLKEWMQTYLAEIERATERDPDSLPMVRGWERVTEVRKWPETQLPAIIAVSAGLTGPPVQEEDGEISATWRVGVIPVTSANTQQNSSALSKLYAAAARAAILQHPSLGGFAQSVTWVNEDYNPLPSDDEDRTLAAAYVIFDVEVAQVLNRFEGPSEVPDEPYDDPGDWPEIEETDVEVQKL